MCCTNGMTFFMNFFKTSIDLSCPRSSLLSGNVPPLLCKIRIVYTTFVIGLPRQKRGNNWALHYYQVPDKHYHPLHSLPREWTVTLSNFPIKSLIAFDERELFGFCASGHCLVRVRMLHYLHVDSRTTITQSHTHTMQQTHTHKTVTGHVKPKSYSLVEGNRSIDCWLPAILSFQTSGNE